MLIFAANRRPQTVRDMLTGLGLSGHRLGNILAPLMFLNGLVDSLLLKTSYSFEAGTTPCSKTGSCRLPAASINAS